MLSKAIKLLRKFLGITKLESQLSKIEDDLEKALYLLDKNNFFDSGERQVTKNLAEIRPDHRGRYNFASSYLKDNFRVLDMACGVGYGSYILAKSNPRVAVLGVDISEDAIAYANRYYKAKNNNFVQLDASSFSGSGYDFVSSFETIEHVEDDRGVLTSIHASLNSGGIFVGSVPNEAVMPFSQAAHPYHIRHYTHQDIDQLLRQAGFSQIEYFSQNARDSESVDAGIKGLFLLFVCKKIV